jgi:hypothetical protein
VALRDRDGEQSLRSQLRPQVAREGIRVVDLGGPRGDPLGGEALYRVAQGGEFLLQSDVEVIVVAGARKTQVGFPVRVG